MASDSNALSTAAWLYQKITKQDITAARASFTRPLQTSLTMAFSRSRSTSCGERRSECPGSGRNLCKSAGSDQALSKPSIKPSLRLDGQPLDSHPAFSPFPSARKMSRMLSAVLPRWLMAWDFVHAAAFFLRKALGGSRKAQACTLLFPKTLLNLYIIRMTKGWFIHFVPCKNNDPSRACRKPTALLARSSAKLEGRSSGDA